MGIEPTWDAAQRPTLDLKSRRATSALSTSVWKNIISNGLQGVEKNR
jgi:hypothetical protein